MNSTSAVEVRIHAVAPGSGAAASPKEIRGDNPIIRPAYRPKRAQPDIRLLPLLWPAPSVADRGVIAA